VGFEVRNNNRVSQQLPEGQSRIERIAKCYSPELAASMLHVERDERGVRLEAYLAPPAHSRASAQWQYAFVNGRYVRDRFIHHAIKEAYRGLIEHQRHPVVFVFLTVDPHTVDVNVHPTKIEVRWADSGLIHSQVLSALRETLQRADLAPNLRVGPAAVSVEEQDRIRREMAEALKSASPMGGSSPPAFASAGPPSFPGSGGTSEGSLGRFPVDGSAGGGPGGSDAWRRLYAPLDPPGDRDFAGSTPGHASAGATQPPVGPTKVVQMHNLYLVAESEDGIVIIDQHALHERVMYEELTRRIAEGPLESQRLLLPETIRVTPGQMATLDGQAELLTKLGIEVTPFGEDSIAVHGFPVLLKDADVAGFMRDLIDLLSGREVAVSTEVVIHKVLDMMACKAAVKSGDPLSEDEIRSLIAQKGLIDKSSNCPHGRPTTLRLTRAELDRQFKRT